MKVEYFYFTCIHTRAKNFQFKGWCNVYTHTHTHTQSTFQS